MVISWKPYSQVLLFLRMLQIKQKVLEISLIAEFDKKWRLECPLQLEAKMITQVGQSAVKVYLFS